MKMKKLMVLMSLVPLTGGFYGCASNANQTAAPSESSAPSEDGSKAEKKISMAIGREVGRFAITGKQVSEAPAGQVGTLYTVKTKDGATFKCEILEPSGVVKVFMWGMASGSSAMCTDFTPGSKDKGKTNKASCNELLRAAGKC